MPVFTRENFSHAAQVFLNKTVYVTEKLEFFEQALLSLLLDTIDTPRSRCVEIVFFSTSKQNKSNTFHNKQMRNFFTAHIIAHK